MYCLYFVCCLLFVLYGYINMIEFFIKIFGLYFKFIFCYYVYIIIKWVKIFVRLIKIFFLFGKKNYKNKLIKNYG